MIKAQGGIRKSGILSPWRNPLDPGDRFYRRVLTRAIMNFNGTQYATLSEPVVLEGDFEIEVYFNINFAANSGWSTIFSGSNFRVSGGGTNDDVVGQLRADGAAFGGTIGGSNPVFEPALIFTSEKIERLTIVRSGSDWVFSNGRSTGTLVRSTDSVEMSTFLKNVSSVGGDDTSSGVIFSMRVWKNGDRTSGELVTDLRFDEPATNHQRNYAVPVGSELVTNGDFSQGLSGWSPLSASLSSEEGVIRVTSTVSGVSARAAVTTLNDLVPGQVYRVTTNLVGSGGTGHINTTCVLNMRSGINGSGIFTSSPVYPFDGYGQRMELIFTADAESMNLWVRFDNGTADTSTYVEFGEISAQSWSGAILENTLPGDWEEISKKSGDDFWLGVELADQSVATLPGEYIGGSEGQYWYWDIAPLNKGDTVLIRSTMSGNQSSLNPCGWSNQTGIPATSSWRDLGGGFSGSIQLGGVHTSASSDGIAVRVFCSSDPDTDITFTNISVKRYLEYAEGAL